LQKTWLLLPQLYCVMLCYVMLLVWWINCESTYSSLEIVKHFWIWHPEDRASWYILIIKPTRCTNFSNLFLE